MNKKIKYVKVNGVKKEIEGKTAYQIACEHGFEGTEAEWLASLKGEKGDNGDITNLAQTLEGNEEDKAPSVKAVKAGLDELGGRIARNDKRLTNIEQGIPPELFETDSSVAYKKDIPEKALPFVEISKIGGMTYKDSGTLKNAKVTEIESVGVNLIDLKDMPIDGSGVYDAPITLTEGKYWLSIFDSDGTGDGWKRGTAYAARFMHDEEIIVSSVDYGGVVTKEQASQINKLRIFIAPNNYTGTSSTFTAMLNKGETHAPLIPHFKRTIPIPEAVRPENGINSEVFDYIEWCEDGSRKKVVRCCVMVFDGTENWGVSQYTNRAAYLRDYTLGNIGAHLVCSHFQEYTDGISWKTNGTIGVAVEGLGVGTKSFFFGVPEIISDAETWKAYLAAQYANGNPVMIVYELATPIVKDISDILTSDNYIEVERGGTITAVNENGFDVPSEITYMLEEETV